MMTRKDRDKVRKRCGEPTSYDDKWPILVFRNEKQYLEYYDATTGKINPGRCDVIVHAKLYRGLRAAAYKGRNQGHNYGPTDTGGEDSPRETEAESDQCDDRVHERSQIITP